MSTDENPTAATLSVTLDCNDPDRLSRFWAEALRYRSRPLPFDHGLSPLISLSMSRTAPARS